MSRTSWVTRALLSACEVDGEEESLEDRLAALEQQLDTRIAQKLAEADRVVGAGR